ncbi:SMP-30/gluconolactonase/LRE family protein [Aeromicrobium wangtongii]|uniref:Esterase-like activity of phytase family protein n=1 Tax=Aeromicrobium wangtongii TaxID=2969247 RepID=A0ABY5M8X7_9ACTN|nr:hypothetical protein [Aeromicrobium wangtongii]MCD9196777.1 hypothetical protein [Aeromicrobium wangtongii]UUP14287.1 hypothetical protein NQV15_02930 [Aeromicrobium wangtongii]
MNPRHRRLLIPGLLIALLVVVVIASLAGKADAATDGPQRVSTLDDPRINESSGLVLSIDDADRAYTINDSGSAPIVYALDVPSGRTVGTTRVDADLVDTEALSIDAEGTLWIADTGDNRSTRTDAALYSLPAAEQGSDAAAVTRYPVTYPGGPIDVEALAVDPRTGDKFLISKGLFGGTVFSLPDPLVADQPNEAVAMKGEVPGLVTDAAFTKDGRHVVARTYTSAYLLDPATWDSVMSIDVPSLEQGETLATEPSGRSFLVGSEGAGSPIVRVSYSPPAPAPDPTASVAAVQPPVAAKEQAAGGNGFPGATWFWALVVVGLLTAIGAAATRRS